MGQAQPEPKQTTNTLLLLTIFNHASWSTLHIASRYLQVYAKPITFDGQGVLSSAKGFAALFLFFIGIINSWIESSCRVGSTVRNGGVNHNTGSSLTSLPYVNATLSASASYLCDSNHNASNCAESNDEDDTSEQCDSYGASLQQQQQQSLMPIPSQSSQQASTPKQTYDNQNEETASLRRKTIVYTLLFAFVSTSRASTNIASSKYTYPYNITLIASLTPVIIAIFDRIILRSPFPPLLWPTIILSGLGGCIIAISQNVSDEEKITRSDNLTGCLLQLFSAVLSAVARILMKRTEHILTPTHIVQTNNISNCIFPFIYTIIHNPSSWRAFRYLIFTPKSLLAWCSMSIGVYSFASTLQIRLVRKLGPGFYSSWVAVRVLGSMILSTYILGEGVNSWLEWVGIGLMIVTISVYIVETRKWMDHRNETQEEGGIYGDGEEEGGEEELVPVVPDREDKPLLADANAYISHKR